MASPVLRPAIPELVGPIDEADRYEYNPVRSVPFPFFISRLTLIRRLVVVPIVPGSHSPS